ncbi:MAG: hypothetical protein WCO44_17180 [Bacteroidota bacterium]
MGFGRSGTSMMGGILHQAGYFMGDDLYPPRDSNPQGFFENAIINGINEKILSGFDHYLENPGHPGYDKYWSPFRPGEGHRWLGYYPLDIEITSQGDSREVLLKQTLSRADFAYKDPRFNYTLPVWLPYLPETTMFICLFREPGINIGSVLKECETAGYLGDFALTKELAENLWCNSYNHLLKNLGTIDPGRFIFVHFRQLLSGDCLPFLSQKLGVNLTPGFIAPELERTRSGFPVTPPTESIYRRLCSLAGYPG